MGRPAPPFGVKPEPPRPTPNERGVRPGASRVGVSRQRRVVTAGRDPGSGPIPLPRRTNGRRPPAQPGPCGVGPPPARAFSAGAPSTAPRPAPVALTPAPLAASLYCAGARAPRPPRLRLGLGLRPLSCRPPAPGHRPPRPAGGPAPRPRPPPPTRGPQGRSRPRARHGQSSPYPRAEERPRKWARDWSGLLKGPPPTGLEGR
ncbi:proline-rich protein 2-like [Panthera leo]|uniref:proline-rich protein 2-like n=1 Tax=Panthera leo TaxID=9689 RepID=UPI001C6A5176|nr:proline-rich protein 2-like [Panthera leo]